MHSNIFMIWTGINKTKESQSVNDAGMKKKNMSHKNKYETMEEQVIGK